MPKQLKTEITREEITLILELYNTVDNAIDHILECLDIDISTLRDLRQQSCEVKDMFDFRPRKDDHGGAKFYANMVLLDDPDAWFFEDNK